MPKEEESGCDFNASMANAMMASPIFALGVFGFVFYVIKLIGGLL